MIDELELPSPKSYSSVIFWKTVQKTRFYIAIVEVSVQNLPFFGNNITTTFPTKHTNKKLPISPGHRILKKWSEFWTRFCYPPNIDISSLFGNLSEIIPSNTINAKRVPRPRLAYFLLNIKKVLNWKIPHHQAHVQFQVHKFQLYLQQLSKKLVLQ